MEAMTGALLLFGLMIFFYIGDRYRQKRIRAGEEFRPESVLGDAGFATKKWLKDAGYFRKGGIRIGFFGKLPLFYNGAGHILLVAAARAGKALTVLVETILSLGPKRSMVVFDPKGELTCITGHARKRCGEVYVLNPFGILLDHMED